MFRQFLKYCVPTVLSLWVFSLYTMVDGVFVARGVSEMALSAVNICMPFMQMLFAVSILFAVGTSTVASILSGQKKHGDANRVFTQNAVVLGIAGIAVTAVVFIFADNIAAFLGAVPENKEYVRQYLTGIAPFCISIMISYSLEILVKPTVFPGSR
jgi:Na+-driven multidrug efflux pump